MIHRGKTRSLTEILIELREDDPEFKQAITPQSFRVGQVVAEPNVLSHNLFTLMKGRVQLIREGPERPPAGDCDVGSGSDVRGKSSAGGC